MGAWLDRARASTAPRARARAQGARRACDRRRGGRARGHRGVVARGERLRDRAEPRPEEASMSTSFFEELGGRARVQDVLNVLVEAPFFYPSDDPDLFAYLRRHREPIGRFFE